MIIKKSLFTSSGISILTIISVLALLLVVLMIVVANINLRQKQSRDELRIKHLEIIGLAQVYYFNQHQQYGMLTDLYQDEIIKQQYLDPASGDNYKIFLNVLADEWCTWSASEAEDNKFYIQTEQGPGVINKQPINLATCKE
ncbi:MAG: hypothetical protein WC575_00655 [Patescibacteria group bacterium]